jgi:hypothetical protein
VAKPIKLSRADDDSSRVERERDQRKEQREEKRREPVVGTHERRTHPRFPSDARVLVRLLPADIAGIAENISESGLLFFSDDCPRVEVEIVEDGKTRRAHGRLVRMQRLRGTSTGFAVELDGGRSGASEAREHDPRQDPE